MVCDTGPSGEDYAGLALSDVGFDDEGFRFELPNGDDNIEFSAMIQGELMLGGVVERDQVYPLVMTKE